MIAPTFYFALAGFRALAEAFGLPMGSFPLSYYRCSSLYMMRTESCDRFGAPLDQRFTRHQICAMYTAADLMDLRFSLTAPNWCVVGFKSAT